LEAAHEKGIAAGWQVSIRKTVGNFRS